MNTSRIKVVVTGLAATYPFGGVFWDYIQYPLGLSQLGHDVLYLEDTGKWCYSPVKCTFVEDGDDNARYLGENISRFAPELAKRWTYTDATDRTYGRPRKEALAFCRDADLFLHISASCWMRDEYFEADVTAFIDSDPMYTQASFPTYLRGEAGQDETSRVDMLLRHDIFYTFAENIHGDDCVVPRGPVEWIPTRQPVVLDCFAPYTVPVEQRRDRLTTVASWEPHEKGPVVDGVPYGSKRQEFERFIDLPRRSSLPLELALSGEYPHERLLSHGWHVLDAYDVSADPQGYRDYLSHSRGEWSVAKHAYVFGRSGWFSCRSACYLALGVPVIVQDTGLSKTIPTGEGVLTFATIDEAVAAIESLRQAPRRHARAAQEIAVEYFDSGKILSQILETALHHDANC